jgi:trans-aconitate methyltransferase
MLERARADHSANASLNATQLNYQEATFESFLPSEPLDLIFSNAALHWVSADLHKTLLPKLFSFLKPGGVIAFQIPDTRAQPSHQLMVEAARQLGWHEDVASVRWVTCEQEPSFYYEIVRELLGDSVSDRLDMWSTTYAQIMEGENPVADFTSSTGLGPYIEALGGRGSPRGLAFEAKYRELIAQAYPKQSDGRTLFNFKRFFLVATKPLEK